MKRILLLVLTAMLLLVGCQTGKKNDKESKQETAVEQQKETKKETSAEKKAKGSKKKVTVTTTFVNDMVKSLVGDKVDLDLIIPAGSDPHVYEAKPEDLKKIKDADLVLYHGLHFEGKMDRVLEKSGKAITEGFAKNEIGEMEEDGKMETDPHFWFDLNLYKKATTNVAKYLSELLPEEKANIDAALKTYLGKLDELDKSNKEKLAQIPENSKYLITPHDAFNYFARAYKFEVKAPQGVSTDSEVANSEIEETAKFIAKHKIKAIFAESTTNPERMKKLQEVVKKNGFDVKVVSGEGQELFSDSLAPAGEKGDTFIEMYKHNVELIVKNLK